MGLLLPRPSLTASGAQVNADDKRLRDRLNQAWQARAWEYYDALGELKYASQYYSRTLAKIDLIVQKKDGSGGWEEVQDEVPQRVLDRIQLTAKKKATYGRLLFLVGEANLACFFGEPAEADGEDGKPSECWEVLSTDELTYADEKYSRKRTSSAEKTTYPEVPKGEDPEPGMCTSIRFWREHPRYSGEPDSSVRGILDICEELLQLQQAIRAQARSRSANSGILIVPEEMTRPSLDIRDGQDDPRSDKFIADLGQHLMTPIADEGSAASVVPLVVRVPAAYAEAFRHLMLGSSELYKETGLRKECIERMALGLDMPPSVLTGTEDANHWSAWQVSEESFRDHLEPFCDSFAGDLTEAYFHPQLQLDGFAEWDQYRVYYDSSKVVSHPNKGEDAKELHDRLAISDKALRTATGFDEPDAPSAAEIAARVARDRSAKLGGAAPPSGGVSDPSEVQGPEAGVQPGPPAAAAQHLLAARVVDWAELCVMRSREIAGSRLRTKVKEPAAVARIRGAPNRNVASILGVGTHDQAADSLVAGGGDLFACHLQSKGIDPNVARHLVRVCEEHAATTLYDPEPELSDDILGLCALAGMQLA